jgi:hypothetical protein
VLGGLACELRAAEEYGASAGRAAQRQLIESEALAASLSVERRQDGSVKWVRLVGVSRSRICSLKIHVIRQRRFKRAKISKQMCGYYLDDARAGGGGETQSADAQLGDGEEADVIGDGACGGKLCKMCFRC